MDFAFLSISLIDTGFPSKVNGVGDGGADPGAEQGSDFIYSKKEFKQ